MCQIRLLNNRLLGEKYLGMRPIGRYTISKNWIFPSPYEYDMFQKGTDQNVWWSCLWGWKFLRSEMKINKLRYVRSNILKWLVWNIFTWPIILRSAELRDLFFIINLFGRTHLKRKQHMAIISLVPGRFEWDWRWVIFNLISVIGGWDLFREIPDHIVTTVNVKYAFFAPVGKTSRLW